MTNFLKKLVQIFKIFSGGPYRDRRHPKIQLSFFKKTCRMQKIDHFLMKIAQFFKIFSGGPYRGRRRKKFGEKFVLLPPPMPKSWVRPCHLHVSDTELLPTYLFQCMFRRFYSNRNIFQHILL